MEGGINYLRNVVLNDSLGKAVEWEIKMQGLVDAYKCEWKEAVENPEIRKRFNHFVNAPEEKIQPCNLKTCGNRRKRKNGNSAILIANSLKESSA
jgi:hypothetical protein